jgi:hypothetical protein
MIEHQNFEAEVLMFYPDLQNGYNLSSGRNHYPLKCSVDFIKVYLLWSINSLPR